MSQRIHMGVIDSQMGAWEGCSLASIFFEEHDTNFKTVVSTHIISETLETMKHGIISEFILVLEE